MIVHDVQRQSYDLVVLIIVRMSPKTWQKCAKDVKDVKDAKDGFWKGGGARGRCATMGGGGGGGGSCLASTNSTNSTCPPSVRLHQLKWAHLSINSACPTLVCLHQLNQAHHKPLSNITTTHQSIELHPLRCSQSSLICQFVEKFQKC